MMAVLNSAPAVESTPASDDVAIEFALMVIDLPVIDSTCSNCGGRLIGKTDKDGNTVWVCPQCD